MREEIIFEIICNDKAVAFGVVEPLYFANRHSGPRILPPQEALTIHPMQLQSQVRTRSRAIQCVCWLDNAHAAHRLERLKEDGLIRRTTFDTFPPVIVSADDDDPSGNDSGSGLATATAKPKLARPPMFKVILLNDDYTPMEFVVHVIQKFFAYDLEKATRLMLVVHTEGAAVVGIFPRDIAETKSEQVNLYAQENHHPLMSTIEMTD